ncbi:LmbE family protein [Intrasporangium calvum DSM 43043]|uniref:LmbE family protein n=1 Tax=Intrasporangium calvum (strain ATCC 23552 / DSM 43043 / JCM 3097 / NBRC 12989 / NCIMB 10167 / NRRL B-3866 / 7 KIP) TaxID=710696 RepID=E6SBZ8_INTC7|nr:LmbE family protein [Intrasporangium calvum DSM 43043]
MLAVVAHPDDESFALGAVLAAFAEGGARVSVLCLTRGEASTLHGVAGDLLELRAAELAAAADVLGLDDVELLTFPDGRLTDIELDQLADHVSRAAQRVRADGLVGFDLNGVTGHPDHGRATAAAVRAADQLDLPVLGWTVPEQVALRLREEHGAPFDGYPEPQVDLVVPVDRTRQLEAVACHSSQAVPGSVMWRRIELLGEHEHLRWLRRTDER